jgi:hypothetical protein
MRYAIACSSHAKSKLINLFLIPGLVALQVLSRTEDRAVATSTRNLLRSLGGVAGVAVSTALQYTVTEAALRSRIPADSVPVVLEGRWRLGDPTKAVQDAAILDARMKGFQAVFAMLVPLMAICLLGSFFVSDEILKGDEKEDANPPTPASGSKRLPAAPLQLGRFSWEH